MSKNSEVEKIVEKMVVRRIRGKDFDQLFRLIAEGFKKENAITGFDARRLQKGARLYRRFSPLFPILNVFRVHFPNILVAVSDGILIGAINLVPHRKHVWSIDSVTVSAAFRGHGVYKRLMTEALNFVSQKGGKRVVQSVWTDNVAPVKVSKQLEFTVFEEDIMLATQFSKAPLVDVNKDAHVREFRSTDKEQVYEIFKSVTPDRLEVYDNVHEDLDISFLGHIADKLAGSHSKRWVIEAQGKTAGYASVKYTSSNEAGKIEHFFVTPSNDSTKLEDALINTIVAFLATRNIGKAIISLDKQRKQTIETFRQADFRPFASSYEMMKTII